MWRALGRAKKIKVSQQHVTDNVVSSNLVGHLDLAVQTYSCFSSFTFPVLVGFAFILFFTITFKVLLQECFPSSHAVRKRNFPDFPFNLLSASPTRKILPQFFTSPLSFSSSVVNFIDTILLSSSLKTILRRQDRKLSILFHQGFIQWILISLCQEVAVSDNCCFIYNSQET